ncbi:flagellar basal body rod protein FlgF [Enterobacteriaceae bacterium YMB-R22]|jgi:flagellar basal-body rod protein FlgF|uniref:Flagellar basal-body rod protein FlgF n=1 Tax=Tenebrionicola larvae TaxID=2815733 RepID=A0A949Q397_9ENTR|nr:flagellar basal body rod protein FlgF [Tenebrionicola larvae]MBV4413981.1 flagellar basal body rod protein FlgF [Tenebrionicola larvae]MBV5096114.1 flagellar basal body rod protein FlgF [Tenebrionicola larvae]
MDRAIYTALSAASAALEKQAVTSNNLANASTPGFRAQLAAYRAVPINGPSIPTRTLVAASTPYHDSTMGTISPTGRNLDVALPQNGWLAVQLPDGTEGYTRNGAIQVDAQGALSVRGYPLLGDGGPMTVPPQAEITIAPDGTVSALGAGDEATAIAQVGRLKMVSADTNELRHGDDGLFHVSAATAAARGAVLPQDQALTLIPGALEDSNVSPVKSMVDMISNARSFDMQMKTITNIDDNAKRANQLLSLG